MARGRILRSALRFSLIAVLAVATAYSTAGAQPDRVDSELIKALRVRNIGPANLGGRIHDVEGVENDPSTLWVGHASGGVFKTTNHGTTWESVFDRQVSTSLGDIAIAPSNPSIVYVGTGEANNRQSSSWGNGVYKTMDGGRTWVHLGLEETHHIGRVRVHPTNPDIVWVGAVGHLWGPNSERGVYMSTDGGATWSKTLFISEDTGIIDLVVDMDSPNTLLAAAYQRRRTGFGFNGGGPEGGIYKSIDGGRTWRKLTDGLPTGDVGRIGLDICRSNTDVVYAVIESRTMAESRIIGGERQENVTMAGVYRSDDKGDTWRHQSTDNPRPMYYSQIRVNPQNHLHVLMLGTSMYESLDGGISWSTDIARSAHVDHHALWWNPGNQDHIVLGNDGGLNWTWDRGRSWVDMQTIPWAQFYEISADNREPFYNVMGGLQDNGTWYGPSGNYWRIGITNRDWITINGGDGFYAKADPVNPDIVYVESQSGNLARLDMSIMSRKSIRPQPPEGSEERYRFNWNSPLEISPHNPARIYYGGNRLFISDDRGDNWTAGEDLTKQIDRNELEIMGVVNRNIRLSRNDGISTYGTITTISESPHTAGILWVGTDDGNLQVSRDGGQTWTNVVDRIREVPERTYVTRVVASRYEAGRAYVTFDGHRNNDFEPYVFLTEDFGRRWTRLSAGIPAGSNANVIREHHRNPNLLLLGTERGAYWSFNRGQTWNMFEGDLPRVPVDDIYVHPTRNDIIFGTHGRGAWIMDDIGPLEGMSREALTRPLTLFPMRYTYRLSRFNSLQDQGEFLFQAPNPSYGAVISYFLADEPGEDEKVEITIRDAQGDFVRSLEGSKNRGVNRVTWDFRHTVEGAEPPPPTAGGRFRGRGGIQAPEAIPGTYTVTVERAGQIESGTVEVRLDPRLDGRMSTQDMVAQRDAVLRVAELQVALQPASRKVNEIRQRVQQLNQMLSGREFVPEEVRTAIRDFNRDLNALNQQYFASGFRSEAVAGQLMMFGFEISGITGPMPADVISRIDAMRPRVREAVDQLNEFIATRIPALNRAFTDAGLTFIDPVEPVPPPAP